MLALTLNGEPVFDGVLELWTMDKAGGTYRGVLGGADAIRVVEAGPMLGVVEIKGQHANDAGDVFVAGGSIGIGTRKDYVTIKYSESAFYIWTVPASAEAAGPGHQGATASSRFGVIFAFGIPLLAVALLRRRLQH